MALSVDHFSIISAEAQIQYTRSVIPKSFLHLFAGNSDSSGSRNKDCVFKCCPTEQRRGVSTQPLKTSTSSFCQTGLPAGVYMLVRHNGNKAVLIVKAAETTEPAVRQQQQQQQRASSSVRTLSTVNPTSTSGRTVIPKIIKPLQFAIRPTSQETSSSMTPSSSGLTCYGTTKSGWPGSGLAGYGTKMSTGTKNSQNPVSQKYRTPLQVISLLLLMRALKILLQLFTADLAPSIAASPHLLDRR